MKYLALFFMVAVSPVLAFAHGTPLIFEGGGNFSAIAKFEESYVMDVKVDLYVTEGNINAIDCAHPNVKPQASATGRDIKLQYEYFTGRGNGTTVFAKACVFSEGRLLWEHKAEDDIVGD